MSNKILEKVRAILDEAEKQDKPRFVIGEEEVNDTLLDSDIYCSLINANIIDNPKAVERQNVVKKLKKPCILLVDKENPPPAWYMDDFNIIYKVEYNSSDTMSLMKGFAEMLEKAADKEFIANALKKKEKGNG